MPNQATSPAPETLAEAFERTQSMDGTLKDKLTAYAAWHRELSPLVAGAYDRLIARIVNAGAGGGQSTPDIGDEFPGFLLPNQEGRLVSLDTLIENGPAVISFNRGHWCPYCRTELRGLVEIYGELQACGATVVSIVPERQQFCYILARDTNLPAHVLSDLDLSYAMLLGLVIWAGDELSELFEQRNVDLPRYQSNDGWMLPVPATFVVDSSGCVTARFVDPDFRSRMPTDDILAAVKS